MGIQGLLIQWALKQLQKLKFSWHINADDSYHHVHNSIWAQTENLEEIQSYKSKTLKY